MGRTPEQDRQLMTYNHSANVENILENMLTTVNAMAEEQAGNKALEALLGQVLVASRSASIVRASSYKLAAVAISNSDDNEIVFPNR